MTSEVRSQYPMSDIRPCFPSGAQRRRSTSIRTRAPSASPSSPPQETCNIDSCTRCTHRSPAFACHSTSSATGFQQSTRPVGYSLFQLVQQLCECAPLASVQPSPLVAPPQAPSHGTLPKAVRMRRSDARARSELKVETHPTLLDTLLSAFTFRS